MEFAGIQKLTLLDYPGLTACTVFTQGCNLRCPYCHNSSLLTASAEVGISSEEILRFLDKRRGLLDGVCISGGEPTLHRDLAEFCRCVKALGYSVKLDTNGTQPERLAELLGEGLLDSVAMDIKNAPGSYATTVGAELPVETITRSVTLLRESGIAFELRTTVVRELHTREQLLEMAQWLAGEQPWYLQSYRHSESVLQEGLSAYSPEELESFRREMLPYVPHIQLRGVSAGRNG